MGGDRRGDWEEGEVTPLSKRTMRELERRSDEIYAKFWPKPNELRHWIPMHSCHLLGGFGRDLAKAWDGSNWQVVPGIAHTTVVDFATGRIFDVLQSETETAKELIDFVCSEEPFPPLDRREQIQSNEGLESAEEPA
jgi:hypothetical protein